MIRTDDEFKNLNDEDYAEVIKPADDEFKEYLENNILYDIVANFIFIKNKHNVIPDTSSLIGEYNTVLMLLSNMPRYKEFNIEKLKTILEKKHSLKLTSVDPIRIEEIK